MPIYRQDTGKRDGRSKHEARPIPKDFEEPPLERVYVEEDWYRDTFVPRQTKFRRGIFLNVLMHKKKFRKAYALSLQTGEVVRIWFNRFPAVQCVSCLLKVLSTDAGLDRRRFYFEAQECLEKWPGKV